jgi:Domain of unknown function (DUF397)
MDIGYVTWRKASHSGADGGNCVEVGVWHKSSYSTSNGGGCVEVAQFPAAAVAIRDSKDADGPKLVFSPREWRAFLAGVKAGEFG